MQPTLTLGTNALLPTAICYFGILAALRNAMPVWPVMTDAARDAGFDGVGCA
jgi:hypothetical protein